MFQPWRKVRTLGSSNEYTTKQARHEDKKKTPHPSLDANISGAYNPSHSGVVSVVVEYPKGYRDPSDLIEKEMLVE